VKDEGMTSRASALLIVVAVVWLLKQLVPLVQGVGDILLLFFLAWLIAFVLEPLVTRQERLRVPRALAVALVYSVLLLGLGLIFILVGPILVDQLGQLRENLPRLVDQLPPESEVTRFFTNLGVPAQAVSVIYRPDVLAQQLQVSGADILQRTIAVATSALALVVNALLLLIISFYMLLDGRKIIWSLLSVLPGERRADVTVFFSQMSSSFGGFLRGQVIQAALFAAAIAALMIVLGMEFVVVAALSSAALLLIPLIGPWLAMAPPLIVALFHPESVFVTVLVVLTIVQFVIVNIIMPRILSGQMGMPPLFVFLAILLGLRIGGPLGAFFGIPIMGVVYGTASVMFGRWKSADDEGRSKAEPPAEDHPQRTNSNHAVL
jgi:predicted PurR-regulated permease PerM